MIHHPELSPADVVRGYPAHLHLNLLPRLQRRGVGLMLLEAWLELASERGAEAVHVGVNSANTGAVRFWTRHGFRTLVTAADTPRTIWMGRHVRDEGRLIRG
jgi:ribosomal protein S18 acetylase RimI-like enzyme